MTSTIASEATRAARRGTTLIPIVTVGSNPVGLGFVASLARPGGNITGLSLLLPEISGKRLELLKAIVPGLGKVAAIWNPDDPGASFSLKESQAAAETLDVKLQVLEARDVEAIDGAFLAAIKDGAEAVVVVPAPFMLRNATRIADLALRNRLPTIYDNGDSAKAGGLISYGTDLTAVFRRAAYYVDRILKGANPADLPVEQPTEFDLVVNLKTAHSLGIELPQAILVRATEVIE